MRHARTATTLVLLSLTVIAAQNQPLAFEVASIKKGDPNSRQVGIHVEDSGRLTTTNTDIGSLRGIGSSGIR